MYAEYLIVFYFIKKVRLGSEQYKGIITSFLTFVQCVGLFHKDAQ